MLLLVSRECSFLASSVAIAIGPCAGWAVGIPTQICERAVASEYRPTQHGFDLV